MEALQQFLPEDELAAYRARVEEGKPAANKLNKMFWWLQPAAIPALGTGGGNGGLGGSSSVPLPSQPLAVQPLQPGIRRMSGSQGGMPPHCRPGQAPQQQQHHPLQGGNAFAVRGSSNSFTSGSQMGQYQQQYNGGASLARGSMPGGYSGFEASLAAHQQQLQMQSICQLVALGNMPHTLQQQQLGMGPPPPLQQQQQLGMGPPPMQQQFPSMMGPYGALMTPAAAPPGSQLANMQAQAQLQQLINSLYLS